MAVKTPTQRFSSRVGNYVRYRPGYPPAVIDLLKKECGLIPDARHRRCRLRHRHFYPHVAGERQSRFRRRAECRDAQGGRRILARYPDSPAWRERRKPRPSPITASTWSLPPRRPTGSIARRRGVSSFVFVDPAAGRCCYGTSVARTRRRFSASTSSCCSSYGTDYQDVRSRAHHGGD